MHSDHLYNQLYELFGYPHLVTYTACVLASTVAIFK